MKNTKSACEGADPCPRVPKHLPPHGACDCHFHIFGPVDRFPYSPDRKYTPPDASIEAYRHILATLGLSRAVIVQPSVYGYDNRTTLDVIKTLGSNFRGVAVIDPDIITTSELVEMQQIGIRGVRVNQAYDSVLDMGYLHKVVEKIQPFGWHLQIFANINNIPDFAQTFGDLRVDVVIDHMGFIDASDSISGPRFQQFLTLLEQEKCWVKLSGAYRLTAQSDVPYSDVTPIAQALVAANPNRCVWGTDWPHPHMDIPVPNDGDLLDLLSLWVPDEQQRIKILVDNPARLYGFPNKDLPRHPLQSWS